MPLVEELNIEKVKRKGLFVMDCHASYEARNDSTLESYLYGAKIAPYNFLIKICSMLKIYNF